MTGRAKVDRKPIKREGITGRPSALDVHNATVSGQFRNVSLTVDAGQVHVLVGTRNSGREELCRAVFGLERLSSGTIAVAGKPSRPGSIRGAIDAGVGYLPSERKKEGMIAGLSVADNMILAHPDDSYAGPFARPAKQRETVEFWIRKLDVRPPLPGRDLNQLSGGNQQKVVLAKWAKDANLKLLMLDHPTRGVDPGAREHINALVDELCIAGAGVLLLADTLDEALMLGHRITVMRDGEISATFDNEGADAPDMALLMKYMV
jgi:ribose transport system ATP-binding protein